MYLDRGNESPGRWPSGAGRYEMENTKQAALTVTDNTDGGNGGKYFAIHAVGCSHIAHEQWKNEPVFGLSAAAQDIADNYGGYAMPLGGGAPGDAPADEAHALSWAVVKQCAKDAIKAAKAAK